MRSAARALNYDVTWRSPYSGIPPFELLDDRFWQRRSELIGVGLSSDRALGFVMRELADYVTDFAPGERPTHDTYFLPNEGFQAVDGALLWAFLRRYKPRRVLELGCGFSSLLIADALRANALDGFASEHEIVDPSPVFEPSASKVRRMPAQSIALKDFESLEAGDVLFVDTTHTVKIGGEVTYLLLECLPRLASGVLIHFHDIFWPYEYPRELTEALGYHWAEQYLLQAFVAYNSDFEILVPAHLLARESANELQGLIGVACASASSLWLRRR